MESLCKYNEKQFLTNPKIVNVENLSDPVASRLRIYFENGYSLSVVIINGLGKFNMINPKAPFEIAVFDNHYGGFTEDILGDQVLQHLTADEVKEWINKVSEL